MRHSLVLIILVSFVGIAVFGFVAMNSKHGEGTLCLANVAKSFGCLQEETTFSLSYFHANIFKHFSTAVILAVLAVVLLFTWALPFREPKLTAVMVTAEAARAAFQPTFHQRFVTWLKLQQKRDPANQILAA